MKLLRNILSYKGVSYHDGDVEDDDGDDYNSEYWPTDLFIIPASSFFAIKFIDFELVSC